jgi:alginate O-acetyltransferase complex protein AlgI
MLFNTVDFLIFLAAVMALYTGARNPLQRSVVLLLGSLFFYAMSSLGYLLLLLASLSVNYGFYRVLLKERSRAVMTLAVTVNLLSLGTCKYSVFLVENALRLRALFVPATGDVPPEWMHWALPLGISFYTFHMLSVMIDVYRGHWTRAVPFRVWTLYVTFFPHMIAGPILRASELVDQLQVLPPLRLDNVRLGTAIFVAGLFKKVLLADHLGPLVDEIFGRPESATPFVAWVGILAFSMQLYFDFSGYSEMAIGLARMFGVTLPRNFLYPYLACNPRDFWNRWHMTFSRWLRDYLYFSLGGNRGGFWRANWNLMLTMLIGGLWHGASWGFVFWGFLNGLFLMGHRALNWCFAQLGLGEAWRRNPLWLICGWMTTLALLAFSRSFFRAETWEDAWILVFAMLGAPAASAEVLVVRKLHLALLGFSYLVMYVEPRLVKLAVAHDLVNRWARMPILVRGAGYAAAVLVLAVFGGSAQNFVYFDF